MIAEPGTVAGKAVSERYASKPKIDAQKAVNARKPRVASVRSRPSTTAPNAPTARPVSTVQLMKARFSAIRCSAGTGRV